MGNASKAQKSEAEKAAAKAKRVEDNRARFVGLAPKRVNNALKSIGLIANCSNRSSYAYSDEEAQKIVDALTEAVAAVSVAFSTTAKAETSFSL